MPLQITARHVELSDDDSAHIEIKADRFRKLAEQISVLDVIITSQKGHYTVEVIVKARLFNATGSLTPDFLRCAFDRFMSKVERRLRKQIDKRRSQKRHSREARNRHDVTLTLSAMSEVAPMADEDRRIVRTQRIAAKPMSVEEAAEQLEIETGAFLVFTNAETETINIIHRREDGHFGLIEPT